MEAQILHDRLLRLFERLDGLEPRDVIVMALDIDLYTPYVDAVFGAAARGVRMRSIAFRVVCLTAKGYGLRAKPALWLTAQSSNGSVVIFRGMHIARNDVIPAS